MAKKKHSNIPIFIPELACPHQCVFCNQRKISGQIDVPAPEDIADTIKMYSSSMNDGRTIELAFFGGSFTGIPIDLQEAYLKAAQPFIKDGSIQGIRLSTRPDYIDVERMDLLAKYGVIAIELGAQSTNQEVLQKSGRGHNFDAIKNATKLIKSYGMELGLQMMIGLPTDTKERSIQTANDIISLGADTTRIYPTIIVKDTALESLFNEGSYKPLSLSEAINWSKDILPLFEMSGVKVLRVGLHPSEDLVEGKNLVAGPMHASFKEMVQTAIWRDLLMKECEKSTTKSFSFSVTPSQLNYAIGFKGSNRNELLENGFSIRFQQDTSLSGYEYKVEY